MRFITIDTEILSPDTVAKMIRDLRQAGYDVGTTKTLTDLLKLLVGAEEALRMIEEEL